jgi:ankyrin repeat protein
MIRPVLCRAVSLTLLASPAGAEIGEIDFQRDVAPILTQQCVDCHGPNLQMADLRLDQRQFVLGDNANPDLIKAGKSGDSMLIQRLSDAKLGIVMPPSFPFFPGEKAGLAETQITTLKAWIDQGANWPAGVKLAVESQAGQGGAAMKALFTAIRAGDHKSVESWLEDKTLLNARSEHRETPLIHAAAWADAAILRLLIDRGADVNAATPAGATALLRAAGDYEKTKLLIERGAKVDARSSSGRTPLLVAATYPGNLKTVQLLLASGANLADQDSFAETALTSAAKRGDAEMVSFLLKAGAHPIQGSRPPLIWAATEGNVATIEAVLQHGGQPPPIVSAALAAAAERGPDEAVRLLLAAGADVNAFGIFPKYSVLMAAAYSENQSADCVRLLLEKGAEVTAKSENGETPLTLAKKHGQTAIVALLARGSGEQSARGPERAPATNHQLADLKMALTKSVTLLQSAGPTFFAKTGCIACHQQSVASLAVAAARQRGFAVDERIAREQRAIVGLIGKSYRERFMQRVDHPFGSAPSIGYTLLGMHADGYPPDDITDAMIFELAGRQQLDGSWTAFGHRPPLEYSRTLGTALAIKAMQLYGPPAMKDQLDERLDRGRAWLISSEPVTTVDRAFQLLGLRWASANASHTDSALAALRTSQRSDGGWSQSAGLASDAYATGLVLYALHEGGAMSPSNFTYRSGVEYLRRNQLEDGSWHVKTRSFPFQPYFESGFPHGHDQWISAAATAFATVALLETMPPIIGGEKAVGPSR